MALPLAVDKFGQDSKVLGLSKKVHSARSLQAAKSRSCGIPVMQEDDSPD